MFIGWIFGVKTNRAYQVEATKANASLSKENKAATKINKNTKFNKESEWEDRQSYCVTLGQVKTLDQWNDLVLL